MIGLLVAVPELKLKAMNTVASDVAGIRGDALSSLVLAAAEDDELLTSIPLSLGGSPLSVLPNPAPETVDESRKWKSLVAFEGEITITDQVRALNLSRF